MSIQYRNVRHSDGRVGPPPAPVDEAPSVLGPEWESMAPVEVDPYRVDCSSCQARRGRPCAGHMVYPARYMPAAEAADVLRRARRADLRRLDSER